MTKRKKRVSLLEGKEIQRLISNPEKIKSVSAIPSIPAFYEDTEFRCQDCGDYAIWTAKDQKWWHETMGKPIEQVAIRCLTCRKVKREEKRLQKEHMTEMANREPHPNEAFF